MLAYLARTLPIVVHAQFRQDGSLISRIERRVLPHELDLNLHMNQARYAQVMELSRTDWVLRSGAWDAWRADGVKPVVASQKITYRRELKLGQRYTLESRCLGLDGRLLRFETHVLVGDRVHAMGEVSLIFIGPDGVLDADALSPLVEPYLAEPLEVVDWRVRR
ncbi:MAG: acyl-CoA thioesterase [Deltaproteobacteria bacterium]|nr:MAG: acyl-CoA thioesterase [Deltaproteobacteria bacterium]